MFLQLNHQQLDVYKISRLFVKGCYLATKVFPAEEKFNLTQQIRRAALSIHLNIAEGSSRKSEQERKRYYEISRGSIIEIDAALDVAQELKYLDNFELAQLEESMIKTFRTLSGLIAH